LRRALNLPYYAHLYMLPLLSDTLISVSDLLDLFFRVFSVLLLVCVSSPGTVYMSWVIIHVWVGTSHNVVNFLVGYCPTPLM
jgi:hypothetical protein